MKRLESVLVFLVILEIDINAQFLEQPDEATVFIPVHDKVTFTCSLEEGHSVDWLVGIPGGPLVSVANMIFLDVLTMERHYTLEGVSTNRSTLSLRETETQTNNGTNITCIAERTGTMVVGNTVTVIFYDAPPTPTNVSVIDDGRGFIISWSLEFIDGVNVSYTLTVLNLNTTSDAEHFDGIQEQFYNFMTRRPCDVYSFTVTAVTAAGNSTPSQMFVFSTDDQMMCDIITTTIPETDSTAATSTENTTDQDQDKTQSTTSTSSQTDSTTAAMEGLESMLYFIIGASAAAFVLIVTVLVLLCCCCKLRNKMRRKGLEAQLQNNSLIDLVGINQETGHEAAVGSQLYAHLNHPKSQAQVTADAAQEPLYAEVNERLTRHKVKIADEVGLEYSQLGKTENMNEMTARDSEVVPALIYAQVDKKRKKKKSLDEDIEAVTGEEKLETLYAQVDKSRKRNKKTKHDDFDTQEEQYKAKPSCADSFEVEDETETIYANQEVLIEEDTDTEALYANQVSIASGEDQEYAQAISKLRPLPQASNASQGTDKSDGSTAELEADEEKASEATSHHTSSRHTIAGGTTVEKLYARIYSSVPLRSPSEDYSLSDTTAITKAKDVVKELEDQLKCLICLDTFSSPKLLQCNHVYCQGCLRRMVDRNRQGQLNLTCPTCRQVTVLPPGGVKSLPPAFMVNKLLEILKKATETSL